MKIILASNNKGKIKEFELLFPKFEVKTYKEVLGNFEILEDGKTFKENAIIKAKAVNNKLNAINFEDDFIVIADDSGISIKALNYEPNIYSARYAGKNATDEQNNQKLISNLVSLDIKRSNAFYTACIAMIYKNNIYTTHAWMHGDVITIPKGTNGFGYDPLFIPKNYEKTLGELPYGIKKEFSHRTKAINLMMKIIKTIL